MGFLLRAIFFLVGTVFEIVFKTFIILIIKDIGDRETQATERRLRYIRHRRKLRSENYRNSKTERRLTVRRRI